MRWHLHLSTSLALAGVLAAGKNRDELADTIRRQEHSHYRNYHHLLATGKPMAPYP